MEDPVDEIVQDGIETIDNVVLSQFPSEIDDDDDAQILRESPMVQVNDAIHALETLRLYEEQQDQGDTQLITSLYKHHRLMQDRRLKAQKQRDIRGYFI